MIGVFCAYLFRFCKFLTQDQAANIKASIISFFCVYLIRSCRFAPRSDKKFERGLVLYKATF